jgi:hypothetical protein
MNVARSFRGIVEIALLILTIVSTAMAKYSGGSGTARDPYQIATAADLILLGESAADYGKHFVMTADVDLDPKLPGRKVFDEAVIAPDMNDANWQFDGTPFAGVFDGNGHVISHLTITGGSCLGLFGSLSGGVKNLGLVDVKINGSRIHVGGLVGSNQSGSVTNCYSTGAISSTGHCVGGLVGENYGGTVTQCYSAGSVRGNLNVAGLVGVNKGTVIQCYSTGVVSGTGDWVGGLVGFNYDGTVTQCYSTGVVDVSGENVGGLVGENRRTVVACFWDTQTSGQAFSSGGEGKTTAEMQIAKTFLNAGWDLVGETKNGTEDIWWINEGEDYPRLVWERGLFPKAWFPDPLDGAIDVCQPCVLSWYGGLGPEHDVYLGDDEADVANATTETLGIYHGRQPAEEPTHDAGALKWGKTYYWRIDEVKEADPDSPWKGEVWSFTTVDFILVSVVSVVDDFDSYDDKCNAIFYAWHDGMGCQYAECDIPAFSGNGTGSFVGYNNPPFAEQTIVYSGKQSMPMEYWNHAEPWYSEAERTWETPQDWMVDGADTLTLYFRGQVGNGQDHLYVAIEDSAGRIAVVTHPDLKAVLATRWQRWRIPVADVRAAGVDVAAVQKMVIGVGDRNNPKPGGTGKIYIDDIQLTKRMP